VEKKGKMHERKKKEKRGVKTRGKERGPETTWTKNSNLLNWPFGIRGKKNKRTIPGNQWTGDEKTSIPALKPAKQRSVSGTAEKKRPKWGCETTRRGA